MTPKAMRWDTMDFVLNQLREMLSEGTDINEALQSLEDEAKKGRVYELKTMKSYIDGQLNLLVKPETESDHLDLVSDFDGVEGC